MLAASFGSSPFGFFIRQYKADHLLLQTREENDDLI